MLKERIGYKINQTGTLLKKDYVEAYQVEVPSLPRAKTWTQTPTS